MAIGKISGAMLFDNLDRQGTDIQLSSNNTSLLYLNFTSNVIGVANASPTETLTVGGNIRTPNVKINGGTISTITPTTDLTLISTGNIKLSNTAVALGNVHATALTYGFVGNLWGYALSPAQPYITSTGTLTSLSVTGNVAAGNVSGTQGTFTNVVGTAVTAAQPNITSIGTLTSLAVTGNTTTGNLSTTQVNATTGIFTNIIGTLGGTGISGTVQTANVSLYDSINSTSTNAVFYPQLADKLSGNSATYSSTSFTYNPGTGNITATNFVGGVYGTLYTAAQPNITSTGTLTALSVTGNVNTGNLLVGPPASANFTRFPNAQAVISNTVSGIQQNEAHHIGIIAEGVADAGSSTVYGIGVYGVGYTNGPTRSGGVVGEAHVSASTDGGSAIGVRGYANDTHSGGLNIGLYGDATNGSANYALAMNNGNILSIFAQTWTLVDNNAGALSVDAAGKAGILKIVTTDSAEGVTMSGYLTVTGNVTAPYFIGNITGAVTGNIIGNVTGNITGTLLTSSQPYITSVGTLTSLAVTGNVSAGNVSGTQGTFVTLLGNLIGNTTGIHTGNVTGNVTGSVTGNVTGTILTAAQPNITSVGTLTSLAVTGNITSGNISSTQGTFTNVAGTLLTSAQPNITSVGTLTSLAVTGNITSANVVTGNISSSGTISSMGNITTTGTLTAQTLVITGAFSSGNVTITKLNVGSMEMANSTIVSPNVITFQSGQSAIKLPVGGVSVRPLIPQAGEIRYNSDANTIEYYNGTTWIDFTNTISSQNFYGDGSTATYTLTQTTTSIGILVSINGTVQQPDIAYSVSGNQITFVEIPQTTDRIDIRFLASSTVNAQDVSVMTPANISVGTGTQTIDSWDYTQFRSAKYVISSSNAADEQMTELIVIHNGSSSFLSTVANLRTGVNSLTFSTVISLGSVLVQAIGTTSSNQLRIQKTYFVL